MDKQAHQDGYFAIFKPSLPSFLFFTMMHHVHNDFPLYHFREPLDGRLRHHRHQVREGKEDIIEAPSHRFVPYTFTVNLCV